MGWNEPERACLAALEAKVRTESLARRAGSAKFPVWQ